MYFIVSVLFQLFTNISQNLCVYNLKILTINNAKFSRSTMRNFHLNTYSFEYILISASICIHLNIYSFKCIEKFSNFYLEICDKDQHHKLSSEENQEH